jgi:signal transduction histidine kinase
MATRQSPEQPPPPVEYFEVDSALLSEVGEKLVTSPHVALAELVKNAYDADATKVTITITFGEDKSVGPRIEIVDDGHGMTREDVQRYWMRIGTSNKSVNSISPRFGRPRTGAKGIGRFACRRLGQVLDLETIARVPPAKAGKGCNAQKTTLHFQWLDFVPGKAVSTIPVTTASAFVHQPEPSLKLIMYGAPKNEWTTLGSGYLQRQLALMAANTGIQRKGFEYDPGFNVVLIAPELTKGSEVVDIRAKLMDAGWGTLTAEVNEEGHAVCTLKAKDRRLRTITSTEEFPSLVGTKLKLAIFVTERKQMRDIEVVSKYNVLEMTSQWGGVQVRHRGFRVYPYGDPNDDWLDIEKDKARRLGRPPNEQIFQVAKNIGGLEKARRSLLNLLGMRNFLGAVEISADNTSLQSKADRMGFVANEGFTELKQFTRFAIDWAMVLRDEWIQQTEEEEAQEIRRKIEKDHQVKFSVSNAPADAIKAMQRTIKLLATTATPRQSQNVSLLADLTGFLDRSLKHASRDILRLRLIASTSTLTLLFAHEVKSLTGIFSTISQEIDEVSAGLSATKRAGLRVLSEGVAESQRGLKDLLELTHAMGVMDSDARPVLIDLRSACQRAVRRFARVTTRYHIDLRTTIPQGFQVGPMLEGEVLAIIINLFSNSIKAVIAGGPNRQIEVSSELRGTDKYLHIRDTGSGLSPKYFEQVFSPMNPDPEDSLYGLLKQSLNGEDSLLLGSGTGLGLSIIRGILRARGGDATILPPTTGWNFHLEVHLP